MESIEHYKRELTIDPEFRDKIPALTEDEFNLLEQMIIDEGRVKDPIVVWNGIIVDGHNRYQIICKHTERNIPYEIYEKDFANRYEAIAWICKNQLGRRNLTPELRKYLIGKQYEAEKAGHGGSKSRERSMDGRFTSSCQNDNSRKNEKTAEKIAKEAGVNWRTVIRAEQFAKAVDTVEEAVPGMKQKILNGEIKVKASEIMEITTAKEKEKKQLLDALKQTRKESIPKQKNITSKDDTEKTEKRSLPLSEIPSIKRILEISEEMASQNRKPVITPENMVTEMADAMDSMIWRWNNCRQMFKNELQDEVGQKEIIALAREGISYLEKVMKGALWEDEQRIQGN